MSLKIIVVGAGIAGLCASLALRQAGHEVEVSLNNTLGSNSTSKGTFQV